MCADHIRGNQKSEATELRADICTARGNWLYRARVPFPRANNGNITVRLDSLRNFLLLLTRILQRHDVSGRSASSPISKGANFAPGFRAFFRTPPLHLSFIIAAWMPARSATRIRPSPRDSLRPVCRSIKPLLAEMVVCIRQNSTQRAFCFARRRTFWSLEPLVAADHDAILVANHGVVTCSAGDLIPPSTHAWTSSSINARLPRLATAR